MPPIEGNNTAERRAQASFFGYQDGSQGPIFELASDAISKQIDHWPTWIDFLPGSTQPDRLEGGLRTKGILKTGTSESPLVTYITVVWNNHRTLERTITSVQKQDYSNVEHIIVDGGSTDGTLEIIKKYADKLDYFVSEPDSGLYDALNKAIPLSRGQLICVLNSDDWLEVDAAKIAASHFKNVDNALLILTAARVADGRVVHDWQPAFVHPGSYFMCANDCHNAIYANKLAYERSGQYDSNYKIAADFKWIMSCLDSGSTFIYTKEPTVNYSLGGTSGDFIGHSLECMQVVQERFPFLSEPEVSGLYHCFFIFKNPEHRYERHIPQNYTFFLRQLLADHSNSVDFTTCLSWASIINLNHHQDTPQALSPSMLKKAKHAVAVKLSRYPALFQLTRRIYSSLFKG